MALFIRTHNRCPSAATALPLNARRLLLVATVLAPFVAGAQTVLPLTLQEALALARTRSPQLVAQTAAIGAAESLAASAGQLPDPKLGIGIDNLPVNGPDRFSVGRDFMTMRKIGLMQEFPREEKRKLRGERADADVKKELATLAVLMTTLRRDVADAWLNRYYAERQEATLRELLPEMQLQIDSAQAQLKGGKGSASDLLAARASQAQTLDRIADAQRLIAKAKANLARWLGEAANRPLDSVPNTTTLSQDPKILVAGIEHHPELQVFAPLEAAAKVDIALAQAAKKPDWSLEIAYAQRGSSFSNMVSVQARIDLPLWSGKRQDPVIAAKFKALEQVRAQREEAQRMHEAEIKGMLVDWDSAKQRIVRYDKELMPLARERTQAALAAYRGGRGGLMPLLEARRQEIDTRMNLVAVLSELAKAWAQLNFILAEEHATRQAQ